MPVWLLGLGKWLWGAASGLLTAIRRNPWPCAVIALCALSGWLWHGKQKALGEIAAIHAAQASATQAQVAVNHEPARRSAEIAEKSDVDVQSYYEKGRRAGMAYADAHRVPATCAPSPSDLPRTDHPVPGDDGPGQSPDMVAISRQDFDTLTGNSLRLAKVQQDAQSLIDAGLAVATPPDPQYGRPQP